MPATTASQSTLSQSARKGQLLDIHPLEFEQNFSQTPFLIGHRLCDHPLFSVDRLLELAQQLPAHCLEYNAGELPVNADPELTPLNGLTAQETIERIASCKSWLVLKYVENDAEYNQLLHDCLAEIAPYSESIAPGMTQAQGFIFLTSPGSVTPYHIDPEHNFLLQIRGDKEIHMYDGRDRSLLTEQELEGFYSDKHRNLKLAESRIHDGWTFQLKPGQGLHFPVTYPHWVKNLGEVSISFSITFRTPDLDRRRALYQVNHQLRQRGFSPTPVGHNRLRDTAYYNLFRVYRKLFQRNTSKCTRSCGT